MSFHSLENFDYRARQFTKRIDHGGAGLTQRLHFAGVRASTTFNNCARQLKKIADRAASESISMDEAATRTLAAMKEAGDRMPGFGHRYHTKDPRTARLFELAREAGVDGPHMKAARAVEKSFADAKKALPINVDGAIGAILADLGMNPAAFNGIFMIARTPGLVAHVIEEQIREKPMRRIDPVKHGYDGPPPRSLKE